MTEPADDPLDEAFAAYLKSCDAGELSSREQFLSRFPELADQLRELMDAADLLGRVTEAARPPASVSPTTGHEASAPARDGSRPRDEAYAPLDSPAAVPPGTDPGGTDRRDAANPGARPLSGRNPAEAETVELGADGGGVSADDPWETLPMATASETQGPSLPFDLGDYELLEVIGRGGMGIVYLANQKALNRRVAIKMIRSGILADDSEVRRFYAEAQAAARLSHPGIVSVHQFGRRAGHHFFSMEYVEGTDLQRVIRESPLAPVQAARYVRDVARAIHHAHENGLLHRDLKPANVLIDRQNRVRVTDFGLAKVLDADGGLTASGTALGTPHYMAPEQAVGQSDRATRQTDVYALGAILFACVTGRPPIVAASVMETLVRVAHEPAPLLRGVRKDAPRDLETIVAKCLEKLPGLRYESADRLADDLDAFLESRPITARPQSPWGRTWDWIARIPLVAALIGRRVPDPSVAHRRFQWAMLGLLACTPLIAGLWSVRQLRLREAMPPVVRIASGTEGGSYRTVAEELAQGLRRRYPVETASVFTEGSIENRQKLLARDVDLAPMQASDLRGDDLCVVAPLFYEAVHVLTREPADLVSDLNDIDGMRVAVGPLGSGSRQAAELVFASLPWDSHSLARVVMAWPDLEHEESPEVAIICASPGSPLVERLILHAGWRLVPIPNGIEVSLQHPTLRPMTIEPPHYPRADLPPGGIPTVGTTAFLAARTDAPSELVVATLNTLYGVSASGPDAAGDEDVPAAITRIPGMISREHAAEWQGLAFHRAARHFFAQSDRP